MTAEVLAMGPRKRQVAALLLQGCGPKEIAESLDMNERTVRNHLRILYLSAGIHGGVKRVHLVNLLSMSTEKLSLPELTTTERRIAEHALQGLDNSEIAALCGISVQMVKNYLSQVYDKCGVWSRTELAARFRCA